MLDDGHCVIASVPSGASVGSHEAVELRDGDVKRFSGKGVLKAIENIDQKIAPLLVSKEPDLYFADKLMIDLDGTDNKSILGANATLAVSIAIARAQAHMLNLQDYELISKVFNKGKILYVEFCEHKSNNGHTPSVTGHKLKKDSCPR